MPRKPSFDRDELILRARDIFWRRGWAGTSLKDLEQELGVKPGSFYAAFGSKEALYKLAMDRYVQDGMARLDAMAADKGPLGALKAYPVQTVGNAQNAAKACMLAKTYLELSPQGHALAAHAHAHLSRMEARFSDLFSEAQSTGDIGPEHDAGKLARRYQSDLLGMRVSAERNHEDAQAIASEIATELDHL